MPLSEIKFDSSAASSGALSSFKRPEILAPAGDWDCVRAAVENGADAIYFGLARFNARMRAKNFTQADLPALMAFLHKRGVRGYVTFNTLVFANELDQARDYARSIIAAGADAAIVQDVGVCRLIREVSPDFPIHASTQMTITSAAGVEFARELGAELVVLARENTLKDIETIQAAQRAYEAATGRKPLPLETFVHGALCVAYSGQCLTSEALGGRSANRGECAQACRLPYELLCDDRKVDLGDRRYLLSPQDLSGLDVLPQLVRAGVASLKIEGRLKSSEYVASITRVYRSELDKLFGVRNAVVENNPHSKIQNPKSARYELEMTFSRGLSTGWFQGIDNQHLVHARFGTKRGVFLGEVARVNVQGESVTLRLSAPLKLGDGVVFDAGNPENREEGGRVYEMDTRGADTTLRFGRGDIDFNCVRPGQLLWKTNDPALDRELRATFEGEKIRHTRPVDMEVHGHVGAPLTLVLNDRNGHVVKLDSAVPLVVAQTQPLSEARLCDQLGRLGGTPYKLGELTSHLEGDVMMPVSELNRLRRDAAEQLTVLRATPKRWSLVQMATCSKSVAESSTVANVSAEIIPVVRNIAQLEAALSLPKISTFYCEFENPKFYREAVAIFRKARSDDSSIWVAPPRISKPGEEWILNQVRSSNADGYLVRNYEHLRFFAADRKRGDFSLNVANQLTAEYYLERYGLERVTASYDLNIMQLEALLAARMVAPFSAANFDITIHQHMPMFHMEHCVFCAFLSSGKDYRDCGRPCEKHRVRLRDRVGAEFPLKADAGCRNTVFNNRAQTGAEYAARLLELGARHFRVEFIEESADEIVRTLMRYQQLLRGEIDGAAVWRELKLLNQLGVTRGQMETVPQLIHRKG